MRGNPHVPFWREAEAGDSLRPPIGNFTSKSETVSNPVGFDYLYVDPATGMWFLPMGAVYDPRIGRTTQFAGGFAPGDLNNPDAWDAEAAMVNWLMDSLSSAVGNSGMPGSCGNPSTFNSRVLVGPGGGGSGGGHSGGGVRCFICRAVYVYGAGLGCDIFSSLGCTGAIVFGPLGPALCSAILGVICAHTAYHGSYDVCKYLKQCP